MKKGRFLSLVSVVFIFLYGCITTMSPDNSKTIVLEPGQSQEFTVDDFFLSDYQWYRDGVPIDGDEAKHKSYTLVTSSADNNQTFTIKGESSNLISKTDSREWTVLVTDNHYPVANAGADQTVMVGTTVQLNAGGSSDPDGDTFTYTWTIISMQPGSTASLSSLNSPTISLTPDVLGAYLIRLVVNDGMWDSQPDYVVINSLTDNAAPVANAGADQLNVYAGSTITLNGGGSNDPDGDPLTYNWVITAKPTESKSRLFDSHAQSTTFYADAAGTYVIQLIVNDRLVDSTADSMTVTTGWYNRAPVAHAGNDQTVLVGHTVTLDGSRSSDLDGDVLSFAWTFVSRPNGSTATLQNANTMTPRFDTDIFGTYVVQLIVNDGEFNSTPDTVVIDTANSRPVANAGADQTAYVTNTIVLNGSGSSDVDGNSLTFAWSFVSRPATSTASLSSATMVNPTFVVDQYGTYVLQLIVNDGTADSDPDTVIITTANTAPVANAGPDQSVYVNGTATLNGSSSSDVDGQALTYSWSFASRPTGSAATLINAATPYPVFTVDVPGTYALQLIVNDGYANSAPDIVTITTLNSPPVAEAGPDQTTFVGRTVTLDGSASSDVDGDMLIYAWAFVFRPVGSTAAFNNSASATPSFTVDRPGVYIAQLFVNDGEYNSNPATVTITTENSAPVAIAGPDQAAYIGNSITLDGSGSSDVDGDPITYTWSLLYRPTNSNAMLSNTNLARPTFIVDQPGSYVAQLIVNDGTVDSPPATVNITTLNTVPVANAGADQSVLVGGTATLNGGGSSDVDGNALTYSWSFSSRPAGSTATLSNAQTVNPAFIADRSGSYVIQLIVNDGTVNSNPDTVTITTANSPPVANAGTDQSVLVTEMVTLNGSGSSDVDGNTLAYTWAFSSIPSGSHATLSNPATVTPTFTADAAGTYVIQLIVSDGFVNSAPDTVTITTENSTPVANAGANQTVLVGNTVILNGSGSSDVDGDSLTYSWSFVSRPTGSTATLSNTTIVNPSFVADLSGTYVVQLIVNDGTVYSAPVSVTITTANTAPVANAGPSQTTRVGNTVTLNGSGSSDVDGDSLTYAWSFSSRPTGSTAALSSATAVNPTFTADRAGTYVVQLIVNDGTVNSAASSVTITTANSAPIANAGADQTVYVNDAVILNGGGSSDADGNSLSYTWSFVSRPSGSIATLSNAGIVNPTFTADKAGNYVIQLIVNDGTVNSSPDTVTITTENTAPVANAGVDQTVLVGNTVTLSGSSSSDVDGDSLTYTWSFTSRPSGSTAALSNIGIVNPTFTADIAGTYVVQLIVSDGHVNSTPDTVTVTTGNSPPTANAGADQTTLVGNTVTLNGSGSSDVDGDPLTYAWSFTSRPSGSTATLSSATVVNPTFVADQPGSYVIQLIVNDGTVNSSADSVTVTTGNSSPAANAGIDQTTLVGNVVTLNGSGSSDPDGDTLTYAWSFISRPTGSTATLSSATIVNPSFSVDKAGSYVIQLIVNDGHVNSSADSVTITTGNSPPTANAGPDQATTVGNTVTLNGSASSDVDGNPLTYAWSFSSRPTDSTATLSSTTIVNPTFVIDRPGSYVVQLIVNDGTVNSAADSVTISTSNTVPIANAGADQSTRVGNTVTLNGSASSDVDGDSLTYSWSFSSRPASSTAALSGTTIVNPTFVPDQAGSYVLQLIVNDGKVNSAADSITVTTENSAPAANAGADQTALVGNAITLNGSGSSDPDGDQLTYAWSFISRPTGSTATLSSTAIVNPTFTVDKSGSYVLQLIVNDGHVNSAADSVTITTGNSPPTANAGPNQSSLVGHTVTLDGSGSGDVDGNPLTYSWSFISRPSGSTAALSSATIVNPTFTVDVAGSYVVQLIVNDGTVNSAADSVTITTENSAPIANAGPDQTVHTGITVTLDGSGSSDVDGNPLTYIWSFISRPSGSVAAISGTSLAYPTFYADVSGDYIVQLIVNDGTVNSAADSVTISTYNSAPVANAGPDQVTRLTQAITLNGSGSSDVDGDPLTYSWAITSRPSDSNAALSASNIVNPTVIPDIHGSYVIRLIVNDGLLNSAVDTVTITTENSPPVANAGPNQSAYVDEIVMLDGSGSSDVDGDSLIYSWSISSRPSGSGATLSDSTAVGPSFTVDVTGTYVIQLIVNDGYVNSTADTITVSTANSAPVANAGSNQSVYTDDLVTLNGSGSTDVDGDSLTYSWSFVSIPSGSGATISNSTAINPTFTANVFGAYVVQLIVNDGTVNSSPSTVTITTLNSPPVANAGSDQTAHVEETVTLNGSMSTDVDGDTLTYSWALTAVPDGSDATLSDPTAMNPTFEVDLPGTYVAQLIVNDETVDSSPDTVVITTVNSPPLANAGVDQSVNLEDTVALNGSGSTDVDGDTLTYSWSLTSIPSDSEATLSDAEAVNPTFTADQPGTYVAQLIVNDGTANSPPDTVTITTLNTAPIANAGTDQTAYVANTVSLNGSGSTDADGNPLTYSWSFSSLPAESNTTLAGADTANPSFTVDEPGAYVLQLIVNDGTVNSAPDTITITTLNSAPVANSGADQSVFVTNNVLLDGSGSYDVDGDGLTYSWSLITRPSGSETTLSATNIVNPWFVADTAGTYVAQLIVNDGTVNSNSDTVTITTENTAPVANAGADQAVDVSTTVQLDGSDSSDVDEDTLTYSWSFTSRPTGSGATLSATNIANPTFTADVSGSYVVQLIVNDGNGGTAADTVQISTNNVAPVANAGTDLVVDEGDMVQLSGGASTDADGDALNYAWSFTSRPTGSGAALSAANIVNPTFTADLAGTYVIQLIVNDGALYSTPDSVQITANVCNEKTDFNDSTLQGWSISQSSTSAVSYSLTTFSDTSSVALYIRENYSFGTAWCYLTNTFASSTYVYSISATIRKDSNTLTSTTGYLYVDGTQYTPNFIPGSNTTHTVTWVLNRNVNTSISFHWNFPTNWLSYINDYYIDNIVITYCAP